MIMLDKRGQGLSTNAIILIILGIVVLAVLIVGFTVGWGKIAPWLSTENVDAIATQCEVACSTQNVYDFCTKERELKVSGLPGGVKSVKNSCNFFATNVDYENYGIRECPGLCVEEEGSEGEGSEEESEG